MKQENEDDVLLVDYQVKKANSIPEAVKQACYTADRRRRELKRRIDSRIGSQSSLIFDKKEEKAIAILIAYIKDLTGDNLEF